jgi:hypothetical protein
MAILEAGVQKVDTRSKLLRIIASEKGKLKKFKMK